MPYLEIPVFIQIGSHDSQQEITIAGHQVTFEDLGQGIDLGNEMIDRTGILSGQPDPYIQREPHTGLDRVDQRDITLDHTGFLKLPDPPQTGGRGKPDFPCKIDILQTAVFLKAFQNTPIGMIHLYWHKISQIEKYFHKNFKNGIYTAILDIKFQFVRYKINNSITQWKTPAWTNPDRQENSSEA